MGLVIFGILFIVAALFMAKSSELRRFRTPLLSAGVILGLVGLAMASIEQIEPGEVGIQILFGKVRDEVLHEGLNVVNPLAEIRTISIKTRNYTMAGETDAIRVLSKDGLEVALDVTILYRVIPEKAPEIYRTIGFDFEDKIVRPIARSRIRELAVEYDAVDLYSEKRDEFQQRITQVIADDYRRRGIELESVLIRNIALPPSIKETIERKIAAIQEAQRMEFVLQKGRKEAELKRIEAQGIADAQRILAKALTPEVLQYEMLKVQKELAKSPNTKILILGGGQTVPPIFLNDK